jgi:phosphoglycolate phosphatase-like HAD superfamily hydrolase
MKMQKLEMLKYKTLVFDCDGVILDSNKIKTEAFYQAALPYGEAAAQALVNYHVQNGGISRYRKFEYFLQTIIGVSIDPTALDLLLSAYASSVKEGLLTCAIAPGLHELRQALPNSRWSVVSGSDQEELRQVFAARHLINYFDGGIFGSPDTKDEILCRELANGNIQTPAIFMGDSRYDYEAARKAGLDFIFISQWTEYFGWKVFCEGLSISYKNSLCEVNNFL